MSKLRAVGLNETSGENLVAIERQTQEFTEALQKVEAEINHILFAATTHVQKQTDYSLKVTQSV